MKLILFDVDLTLVKTGGAGLRALDRAFIEILGVGNIVGDLKPDGKTDLQIVHEICKNGNLLDFDQIESFIPKLLERYCYYLEREVKESKNYKVLPGILEFLEKMHARDDVLTGLATGNIEVGARIKLERARLNTYFPFGGFGSDSYHRSELVLEAWRAAMKWSQTEIQPGETFVIGDTPLDIAAGRKAGFRTVGVATGHYSVEQLQVSGADLVISDFESDCDQFLGSTRIL